MRAITAAWPIAEDITHDIRARRFFSHHAIRHKYALGFRESFSLSLRTRRYTRSKATSRYIRTIQFAVLFNIAVFSPTRCRVIYSASRCLSQFPITRRWRFHDDYRFLLFCFICERESRRLLHTLSCMRTLIRPKRPAFAVATTSRR